MSDLITNGDFEIGSSSTNEPGANASLGLAAGDTTMQGWTVVGGTSNRSLIWAGSGAYGLTAYPGTTDFLDLTGNLDQQPDFGVEQTITTVPGQTYALTFEVGVSLGYDPGVVAVSVMAGNLNTTVTGLAATGTSTWDPVTIDFTATSTASTILIQGDSPGEYIGLDDVAVNATTNAAPPANLVANGSFEQATVPSGSPGGGTGTPLAGGSTAIAGWTVTGTSDLVWIADNASAAQSTPFGDYLLNLAGNHALNSNYLGGAPYDGVTQTIATVRGTTYQLTFDLGNDNTSANTGLLPTGDGIAEPSGSGAMPGWTVIGGTAVGNDGVAWLSNANSYGLTAETGNYFVSLAGYRDNAPYFGVSQTVATTVGQTYALTFYLGVDNSSVYYTGPIGVSVTAGPVTQTIENVSPTGTGNQWVAETVDFTATAASSTISIQGVQGGDYIGLDNVSLVQTGNGATGTNLITNGDFAEPSINPVGVSVTAGPVTTTFNNVAPTALGNTWTPETLDFTATSTTSTISFQGDQGQNYIGLDNVVVSIPTAPSSPTGGVFSEDGKIDTFTVPTSGTYVITGTGATGGGLATGYTGGAGAEVQGTFTLAAGDELEILVGGVGSGQDGGAGSGGGGSFVFDVTTDTLLEAAGGGGGASAGSGGTGSAGGPGGAGQAGTSGTAGGNYVNGAGTSFGGAGGTAGSGGAAGAFVDSTAGSDSGGGGGGFDSAGGDGAFGDGGAGFLAGGAGGIGASLNTQHNGGFGGGGGANSDSIGAGGGGGFSGGGGGEENVGGGGGSFIAPVATDVTLTGGENADGNGSVTIALAAATPDVFTDTEAASSGPLAGSYLWSDPNNWSAGVPSDGATVTADGSGYDDIASLSLASLNVTSGESYVIANSLTVGTVMVSGALTTLFADSGNAPGPVTVTVGAIDTSGNSYGAIGAGSSFIDNSATDPGNSYQAVVGGLVELASLSDASNLQINNGGTIALSNPAASTGALFEDLTAGDVLELPGTSVSNVSFTTNGLTVTTGGPGGGTYAFTNVSYFGTPLSGFTATHDATTGLEAITFTSPDVFTDTEAASSGPLAGSYLWSDPNNWSAGVPSDGATVTADGSGYDDIASLSLASLNVTSGESYVIANSLTVGTVMVSGALTTLFADSGNAPGPVTVTVGAIDTSGNSYGAIGAGSSFIDNSATDPGNSYQAVVGGLVELASLSDASNLQINNGGTIALSNPAASTGALFEDLTAGDVLELPGTSVSNVSFTTNGLTVTTGGPGGGTYAFTNVSYFGTPLSGFTATHDATTGLEAITFTSPDVFTDTEAASSGPLAGSYLWSDPNNWSAGVPSDGATVTADGSGYDDIASLSLASLNVTSGESYVIANSLTVGTVMVSGALTTLFADSGNAPGPVTVTVGAIDTSGNSYGAIGAGSSFIDNSATDPGNSYQAVVGGLVELASLSDASNLQINNGGTIALSNPAASTGALFEDLTAGDVLELPGTSVSNVSFTTNGLTVTTGGPGGGTYAFTNVSYFGTPLSGFTATHDATTGLEAITFTSPDVFTDTEAASSGPLAGSYLWSDPNNWSAGVPSDGATVTADGSGYDDIASLSLASLNVTSGESYVIANSLTVGTVMVSGALTTLFADSGNAPGPVTVTVGAIDTSGNSYGAIGAGSSFIDNSATDPGNSYQAVVGGLVELASLSDASNLQINNGGTIALSNPAASTGALFEDLTAGDVLELPGTSVSNVSFTTNGLTVTTGGPGGGTYAFTNVSYFGTPLSGFTATHDATTGLEAITFTGGVPCYCRGTQIRTDRDEVAVEDLAIGDIVLTMSGTARPIKWIGRRSYKGRFVMGRKDILPICIKAGALDDNVPKRDLWISPNHAMYFENNGGVLVEAKDLVNGVSIVQVARVEEVEYVHIELDTHDVIIAEGALSETFIDDDSRGMFHNADEYCALHSAATMATMVRYCARRLQEGYEIEAVRRHIAPRAGLVSEEPSAGELRGYIDLIAPHVVEGWAQSVDHPEAPVCLDIFSGGRLIGQVLANRFRKDLEQANLGSGCHSFRFAVPDGVTFTPDSVAVKRSLDGKALPQSAQAKRVRKSIAA